MSFMRLVFELSAVEQVCSPKLGQSECVVHSEAGRTTGETAGNRVDVCGLCAKLDLEFGVQQLVSDLPKVDVKFTVEMP